MFPEDDEMDPREELKEIDRSMDMMMERRNHVKRELAKKRMDPKDEKLVEVAMAAGRGESTERHLNNRIRFLEKRIEVRDTKISNLQREVDEHSDYDEWQESSAECERKYKELVKKRRNR